MSESKPRPRLLNSQLYDLYKRLDINGDGTLDLQEFLSVGKKLNFKNESLLVKAFRAADTSSSGTLDMNEFVEAYDFLYYGNLSTTDEPDETHVNAVRYGIDKTKKAFIMEIYSGSSTELNSCKDAINDIELGFKGGLDKLIEIVIADGKKNIGDGSSILWWVNIGAKDILPTTMSGIMKNFGLPSDVESCFYNQFLTKERHSRLRIGKGNLTCNNEKHNVNSFNLFIQSLWLKNSPVVHELGDWFDYIRPKSLQKFIGYVSSRLSQFYSMNKSPDFECQSALNLAENAANVFIDVSSISYEDIYIDNDPILSPKLDIPPPDLTKLRQAEPKFLLTASDLKMREPKFIFDNLSLHLLDFGYGPNFLFTMYKLGNEDGNKSVEVPGSSMEVNIERKSRAGIIGRILNGAFKKLYTVCYIIRFPIFFILSKFYLL